MQIVFGDSLHEMSKPIFREKIRKLFQSVIYKGNCMKWQNVFSGKNKNRNISKYRLLFCLPLGDNLYEISKPVLREKK